MGVTCAEYFNRMALEGGRMPRALIVNLPPLLGNLAEKEGLGSNIITVTITITIITNIPGVPSPCQNAG